MYGLLMDTPLNPETNRSAPRPDRARGRRTRARLRTDHERGATAFQARALRPPCCPRQVGVLPAIRLILVDRSEIGFLSHCLPSPFSMTEANGSQVEFVPLGSLW